MIRRSLVAAAALLLASAFGAGAEDRAGDFDFYVLSLTWSPSWCAANAGDSPQCRRGTGFVVHGLWPQYERGFPEDCPTAFPQRIDRRIADGVADIMPDRRLVFSEWRKHGTCTGLSPERYFGTTRHAFESVSIPDTLQGVPHDRTIDAPTVERAFVAANPGLPANAIAVACQDGALAEVRICLSKDLAFRTCAEVDRRGCRQAGLSLPALN